VTKFVFDNTILSHFARANRLGALQVITEDDECVVPIEVFGEIVRGENLYPELESLESRLHWMRRVELEDIREIVRFARYKGELGGGPTENMGESAALAWASHNSAVAIIDEVPARTLGDSEGIECHGSLWLLLRAFNAGALDRVTLENILDDLLKTDMRLPINSGAEIVAWGYKEGLLT